MTPCNENGQTLEAERDVPKDAAAGPKAEENAENAENERVLFTCRDGLPLDYDAVTWRYHPKNEWNILEPWSVQCDVMRGTCGVLRGDTTCGHPPFSGRTARGWGDVGFSGEGRTEREMGLDIERKGQALKWPCVVFIVSSCP